MSATQLSLTFEITVCFIFLIVLFMRLWPAYRLDYFRQNMFALRDELFDYAAEGHISFNDPAYKLLRQSMNGFIRYAHYLTFFRMFCTFMNWKYTSEMRPFKWSEAWSNALQNVQDENVQSKLADFHVRSMDSVMFRIVGGSPVLIVSFPIVALGVLAKHQWITLREVWKKSFLEVVSRFADPRILEEEAAARATP